MVNVRRVIAVAFAGAAVSGAMVGCGSSGTTAHVATSPSDTSSGSPSPTTPPTTQPPTSPPGTPAPSRVPAIGSALPFQVGQVAGAQVTVSWAERGCGPRSDGTVAIVAQSARRVELRVNVVRQPTRAPGQLCPNLIVVNRATVHLAAPLAGRAVIDAATGGPARTGPSGGLPAPSSPAS